MKAAALTEYGKSKKQPEKTVERYKIAV